jgi:hypothetical protein
LRSVGEAQRSQNRGCIGRAAANPGRDRQSLLERHLAELEAWSKLGDPQHRLVDEIVALDRSGEGPANAQPRILAGHQTHDVAEVRRENDEAFDLVIAVGPAAAHLQGQVDLGAGNFGDRRHRRAASSG